MSKNRTGAFVGGMLLGTAIGAIGGLLFAPRTGRQTRQTLKKSAEALPELAEDLATSVGLHADRLSTTAVRSWGETLDRLRDAIAAGVEASQEEHQVLSRSDTQIQSPVNDRVL
ncbi:YtxH domain-containing protein [Oscillatoriales cyanobacterium LEGE 11467]|uniref:YtxH domain-containing protein n=1 Tax=Zarconia navalis LEGE 11467 TaxID=1828826 RepID=A0A928ZA79_9CYAN|nr:YtxH domain-containing protein [Zarconia navalis]MBE9042549.1 YtxH domain-containing protein [Zarconia navalis LEGE 11467]